MWADGASSHRQTLGSAVEHEPQGYFIGRVREQKYLYPRSHWLKLVGVNSEYFQPEQPSKTLEKVPRRERKLSAGGEEPHTHIVVESLGRCAGPCSRCWDTAGNERERKSCFHGAFLLLGRI